MVQQGRAAHERVEVAGFLNLLRTLGQLRGQVAIRIFGARGQGPVRAREVAQECAVRHGVCIRSGGCEGDGIGRAGRVY